MRLAREDERDAAVGDDERGELAAGRPPVQKQKRDEQDQRGVEVEDKASHARAHVLQADEVEEARGVVADEAERRDLGPIECSEPRLATAQPPGHDQEEGQRDAHPEEKQRHRRHRVSDVDQLHQDRPEREDQRPDDRERDAPPPVRR